MYLEFSYAGNVTQMVEGWFTDRIDMREHRHSAVKNGTNFSGRVRWMNALPVPGSFTRLIVFVQVSRSFNCWGQVSLQGHIWLSRLPWWFPWKTLLEMLPQIFYPNASRSKGLWCLSWVFHCLDTRWPQPLSISQLKLTWNFVLILWTVLHCFTSHCIAVPVRVSGHFWLPKVQQSDFRGGRNKRVCKGKSICCDTCSTWCVCHVLISLWVL